MNLIKQAIEALEELVEYAEEAGFDWSLDNARAALAALRSMPQGEPVATIRYERGTPGKENDMPKVVSCNWLPDGVYSVYATPHTAPLSDAEIRSWWGSENGLEDMDMCKIDDFTAVVRAVEEKISSVRAAALAGESQG